MDLGSLECYDIHNSYLLMKNKPVTLTEQLRKFYCVRESAMN